MNTKSLFLAFCLMVHSAFAAQAGMYQCTVKENRNSGWMPDQLAFDVNETSKTVRVFDPIAAVTRGGVVAGKLLMLNPIRIDISWTTGRYSNPRAKSTRDNPDATAVKIRFQATLLRGNNKLLLKALPQGWPRFSARGDCREVEKLPTQ